MSLLKRIEQSQSKTGQTGPIGQNQSGGGSGLSSLQARRVSAPTSSPQAGT